MDPSDNSAQSENKDCSEFIHSAYCEDDFQSESTVPVDDVDKTAPYKTKARRQDGLRKGKWTEEEERYTKKVIEAFNAGVLRMSEDEKGSTLRVYLAEKLGCDPMRITKKFTGASCLGKRVYHAVKNGVRQEDIDRAMAELRVLEIDFQEKLRKMSQKKGNNAPIDRGNMVTTPAIDALMMQTQPSRGQPGNSLINKDYLLQAQLREVQHQQYQSGAPPPPYLQHYSGQQHATHPHSLPSLYAQNSSYPLPAAAPEHYPSAHSVGGVMPPPVGMQYQLQMHQQNMHPYASFMQQQHNQHQRQHHHAQPPQPPQQQQHHVSSVQNGIPNSIHAGPPFAHSGYYGHYNRPLSLRNDNYPGSDSGASVASSPPRIEHVGVPTATAAAGDVQKPVSDRGAVSNRDTAAVSKSRIKSESMTSSESTSSGDDEEEETATADTSATTRAAAGAPEIASDSKRHKSQPNRSSVRVAYSDPIGAMSAGLSLGPHGERLDNQYHHHHHLLHGAALHATQFPPQPTRPPIANAAMAMSGFGVTGAVDRVEDYSPEMLYGASITAAYAHYAAAAPAAPHQHQQHQQREHLHQQAQHYQEPRAYPPPFPHSTPSVMNDTSLKQTLAHRPTTAAAAAVNAVGTAPARSGEKEDGASSKSESADDGTVDTNSQSKNRVAVVEKDASSLLGFFTQLQRNNSQQDLLEFCEGVQKCATSGSSPAKHASPSTLTAVAVDVPVDADAAAAVEVEVGVDAPVEI